MPSGELQDLPSNTNLLFAGKAFVWGGKTFGLVGGLQ